MKPSISIVTVTFNAEEVLEDTLRSVLEQSYPEIEYIILDGKSTDSTVDIIKKYEEHISYWHSEKDNGLYDAMNKSLEKATGDFILFLNAGDHLRGKDTLEHIFSNWSEGTDVLYGEVMLVDDERKELGTRSELTTQKLPKHLDWKSLSRGMVVCHQGFIPRRELCQPYISNNLSADIDWVIKILKKADKVVHTNTIISDYLVGGVSKKRHRQSLWDRYSVLKSHYGSISNFFNHILILIRLVAFRILRVGRRTY